MGDFAVGLAGRSKELSELAHRVKGRIYLIRGNHERAAENFIPKRFEWIKDYFELKISRSISAVLFHYACRVWNASHHGVFQLYGHSHADLPDRPYDLQMDVGVDTEYADYTPLGLDPVWSRSWRRSGRRGRL
jgi:calcineurin-like phosphoesterase family protein